MLSQEEACWTFIVPFSHENAYQKASKMKLEKLRAVIRNFRGLTKNWSRFLMRFVSVCRIEETNHDWAVLVRRLGADELEGDWAVRPAEQA